MSDITILEAKERAQRTSAPWSKAYCIPAPVKIGFDGKVIPSASKNRVKHWRVTISARGTGSLKQRRLFDTEKEAKDWIALKQAEISGRSRQAFTLSDKVRAQMLTAIDDLKGINPAYEIPRAVSDCREMEELSASLKEINFTVKQAVAFCLANFRPPEDRKRFDEVVNDFLKDRQGMGCRPKTLSGYRTFGERLIAKFGDKDIGLIKQGHIEEWLSEKTTHPRTRINHTAMITTMFNFAKARKWIKENPSEGISRPIMDDQPVGILSPLEASNLLGAALEARPEMVAGVAVGLFGGLRVKELCGLDWSSVHLSRRFIEVTAKTAKKRQRRTVQISDNLAQWLAPYSREAGPVLYREIDGLRQPLGENRFMKDCHALLDSGWKRNCIRHSYISFHWALHRNDNLTAAEAGNSPDVIHKHYREVVHPEDVAAYWNILPPKVASNVIPMAEVA